MVGLAIAVISMWSRHFLTFQTFLKVSILFGAKYSLNTCYAYSLLAEIIIVGVKQASPGHQF